MCYHGATNDESCDKSAAGCAGIASSFCCIVGEQCSANVLVVTYISECFGGGVYLFPPCGF